MSPIAENSAPSNLQSAVYEGVVRHRRREPHPHNFKYRVAQLLLDLDEVDTVFADRIFWSVGRRNLAEFRRSDYLGPPNLPLADAVRARVARVVGTAPRGPIRLLAHLRYGGFVFNPVSFYYCYAADGVGLHSIVAEITNTPWKERHAYVLSAADAVTQGSRLTWSFEKSFHVSPFIPMDREYVWAFSSPGDTLHVHMAVVTRGRQEFDATLFMKRSLLDGKSLARVLWRYPLMTSQVIAGIYWQALRLKLKGNPIYTHPGSSGVPR